MGRTRQIKPGFFTNEELGECEPLARILFAGLWTVADRDGRLEWKPKRLKAELLPYDRCDMSRLVMTLHDKRLLTFYEVDGRQFVWINEFSKHQRPHPHEPSGDFPQPVDTQGTYVKNVTCNDMSRHATSDCALTSSNPLILPSSNPSGICARTGSATAFDRFWESFPSGRRKSKAKAREAWTKAVRKADPETIIAAAAEYAESVEGRGDYVKMPSTWLNGECWSDDRAAWNRIDAGPAKTDDPSDRMSNAEFLGTNQ